jgi:hypothetical protein
MANKIEVKMNEKASQDFLTTVDGKIFYRKNNYLGKEENTEIVDADMGEIKSLLSQGILQIVQKESANISLKEIKSDKNDADLAKKLN